MSEAKKPVEKPAKKSPLKKSFAGSSTPKKPVTRAGRIFRGPLFWILIAIFVVSIFGQITSAANRYTQIETSQALDAISQSKVESAEIVDKDQKIRLVLKSGETIKGATKVESSYVARQEPTIVDALTSNPPTKGWNVRVPSQSLLVSFLFSIIPFLLIGFLFFWMMSQAQGGNKVFQFGKSRAKLQNNDVPKTTFKDVAGADEAIAELEEIKDFLANPDKYGVLGAKIPKGVLLFGPPGTGKTLLARAVAGEAGVPFYSISGSDFVEMFVGVGAARVRDLFTQAKANAPAIVFVDEIDAVGRQRGTGMGGGHDEREQTLNQLLVEMDGFEENTKVILIAATNRPDVLDPALLRPGRFDRQIAVDRPDLKGREAILAVHAKNKPLGPDVKLIDYARRTPGFTGADLANVLNEAALLTAREEKKVISDKELDEAIDRVMAGPQRKSRIMSDDERRVTAYHEAGHALVAHALPHTDPVHKITIMPRGRALGYTMILPDEDRYSITRNQLLDQLAYSLGGRAAEELIFHDPSTGASNDIEKATSLARAMVTQYGMTEAIGAIKLGANADAPFMGRDYGHQRDYSESIAGLVDSEIRKLIENAHQEAFDILVANRKILDEMVLELLDKETLNKEEIEVIFKKVKSVTSRPAWTGSITRIPSDQPPVEVPARAVVEAPEVKKPVRRKKAPSDDQ
ncbi:MAG: ATP-dependent zinc metalloprotease FtsH [Actinomycetes bacterium]